jgi:hypothetical protein
MSTATYARIGYLAHEINRLRRNCRDNAAGYAARIPIDGIGRVGLNIRRDAANSSNIANAHKIALQGMQAEIEALLGAAEYAAWVAECDELIATLASHASSTAGDAAAVNTIASDQLAQIRTPSTALAVYGSPLDSLPGALPVP